MAVRPRHRESWRRCCSARLALWGFLWVDTAGSERTLATRRDLAVSLRRLGATSWEIAGQERKRWSDFADLCLTTWLRRQRKGKVATQREFFKSVRGLPAIIAVRPQRTGERHYTSPVLRISHAPLAYRAVALAAIISVGSTGTGLPMCLSLLAQAAAPCEMHAAHPGGVTHQHAAQLSALVAQAPGQACHQDAAGLGCTAGTACPTAGAATPARTRVSVALAAASCFGLAGPDSGFASFLAPPLSPPPQA